MLQIKTIMRDNPIDFDDKVNQALIEGWQLTKRSYNPGVPHCFYAELEREIIAPHERNCENCLYCAQNGGEPCDSCEHVDGMPDKWEPQAGAFVMVPWNIRKEEDML